MRLFHFVIVMFLSLLASDPGQAQEAKTKLFVFAADDPAMSMGGVPVVATSIVLMRATDSTQARNYIAGQGSTRDFKLLRQLDNNKCSSGKYILGVNNFKGSRPFGVAAIFFQCNFVSEEQAIKKGILDSGKPFWNWAIGDVNGIPGRVFSTGACSYNKPHQSGWSDGAKIGFTLAPSQDDGKFCAKLNAQVPVLVDREPQEVLLVTP